VVAGLRLLPWDIGLAVAVRWLAIVALIGGTRRSPPMGAKAPAFLLLDDTRARQHDVAACHPAPTAVNGLTCADPQVARRLSPRVAGMLAAPPQHEWLEAVKYGTAAVRAPLLVNRRSGARRCRPGAARRSVRYRWPAAVSGAAERCGRNGRWTGTREQPEWHVGGPVADAGISPVSPTRIDVARRSPIEG
jgi:hypothetical protein